MNAARFALLALFAFSRALFADGPADNKPDNVRPVPPKGSTIPDATRVELKAGLADLGKEIDALRKSMKGPNAELLPDVEIYHKAVRYALEYDEMYIDKGRDDTKSAKAILAQGIERAKQLKEGKPAWTTQTGLVVRGYRSKIDGSVQPYGVVVPKSVRFGGDLEHRTDIWWHGRGETLTELNFIEQRQKSLGEFTPDNSFVLHPYGRFCNANKFAGEVDTFEMIEHATMHYPIAKTALCARGFSMGGAACWQFATHYPGKWVAAAPGAGFAETPEFLNNFQGETVKPTWYEERLWKLYNATDYALNIYNLPTIAYSGEIDKQKQAADVMARELDKENIELVHIIGPKTGHKYEPGAKAEISRRIDVIANAGRDPFPSTVKFTTPTLRYNSSGWLRIDGLEKHWQSCRVVANAYGDGIFILTKGVSAFTLDTAGINVGERLTYPMTVTIDDEKFEVTHRRSDNSLNLSFRKDGDKWVKAKPNAVPEGLHKVHGLQGPIDDAFMDKFIIVRPTGKSKNVKVGEWVDAEMNRAIREWRRVFRGDAIVKDDTAITEADIASSHLIIWGDPDSNAVFAKIKDTLPLKWEGNITLGKTVHDGQLLVPIMIYPNPLNPKKYVVLNSGFTFRDYDALNNARQVPKLPDYALVDITTPPNSRSPGKVIRAGFFGEKWELLPNDGQ